MAQILPEKPKKVSYSWFGCFTILAVIVIAVLTVFVLPSIKEARMKTRLNDAEEAIKQTPPSASLSNEDTVVLTVWMYYPVKFGQEVEDYNATEENTNDRAQAIENLTNLLEVEHSLPTNDKYRPLINEIFNLSHQRTDLMIHGKALEPIDDEAMHLKLLEAMRQNAGDIRYVTDILPKDEQKRILDRYYGTP